MLVAGSALLFGAGSTMWIFFPKNGKTHPLLAGSSYFGALLAVAIVTALALGIVFIGISFA